MVRYLNLNLKLRKKQDVSKIMQSGGFAFFVGVSMATVKQANRCLNIALVTMTYCLYYVNVKCMN